MSKYRILLADDEKDILDSLKEQIPWNEYNMEVCHIVNNGKEALDTIAAGDIDIAVLDIRMPGLSGLDIAKYISVNSLKTKVIIASGYAEFSYAQKALQYGVLGYCLKPVEFDELKALLVKASSLLSSDDSKDSAYTFLDALDRNDSQRIASYLKSKGLSSDRLYVASSVSEHHIPFRDTVYLKTGKGQYLYISSVPYDLSLIEKTHVTCLGLIEESVSVSSLTDCLHKVYAMSCQYFISSEIKICNNCCDSACNELNEAERALNSKDRERITSLLNSFTDETFADKFTIYSAQRLYNLVIHFTVPSESAQDYYIYNYRQLINEFNDFKEMLKKLIELVNAVDREESEKDSFSNSHFLKIVKYLNAHYNEDINLNDVASVVNLNPNYISQMFKKSSGTTFSHYLTNLRIENAKKMLSTTGSSISEAAAKAGFNDYFYFLKTFKKATGMTPSEYRENNETHLS